MSKRLCRDRNERWCEDEGYCIGKEENFKTEAKCLACEFYIGNVESKRLKEVEEN